MTDDAIGDVPENVKAKGGWQAVIEDMAATAEAYRERGWETLELHPGDAVVVDSQYRTGLDVLLPGPEYEELETLVEDHSFGEYDVFHAEGDGMVYVLAVEKDPERETAVFVPAYYDPGGSQQKLDTIVESGELRLFCRQLNDDYVEFTHDDPAPFLPEGLR
jgi:hypothetical protein